jgi:CRISPR-associated exonuclease Cas4
MEPPVAAPSAGQNGDTEPIPLSALQHAVYCLRQASLIHLERLWEENRFTAEGQVMHVHANKPVGRNVRGVRRVMSLPLGSTRLGISGIADVVEFHGVEETPYPVEFKRGKPKLHRADEVQLCAQGLCLEEMTGKTVPEGALFYGETKRRVAVPFDADLRALTLATIDQLAAVFMQRITPPPTMKKDRCRACSLSELCRPFAVAKPALAWRRRMVENLLSQTGGVP